MSTAPFAVFAVCLTAVVATVATVAAAVAGVAALAALVVVAVEDADPARRDDLAPDVALPVPLAGLLLLLPVEPLPDEFPPANRRTDDR